MKNILNSYIGWARICCASNLALILIGHTALAQGPARYPGQWHKIETSSGGGGWADVNYIQDFDFIDSSHGICMDQNSRFLYTSDGGRSWNTAAHGFSGNLIKNYLGMVTCSGPQNGNAMSELGNVLLSQDTSMLISTLPLYHEYDDYFPYVATALTITQKMYDTSYGFRLAQDENPRSGALMDSARILVTHDGWKSDTEYGMHISGGLVAGSPDNSYSLILGGKIIDSNDVWVGLGSTILHTTNAGGTWDTMQPTNSSYVPDWFNIVANPKTREVYAEAVFGPIDFAYSSDYGKTWRLDSTFRGLMVRLSVQSTGKLWGILCHHPVYNPPYELYETGQSPKFYQNTIVYSSDTGKSWYVDSATFANDTLVEMHWFDEYHGWIAGYGLDSMTNFIAYYDSNENASVSIVGYKAAQYQVYPNPANVLINTNPPSDNLTVFDPLGRQYFVRSISGSIDVSALAPGIYFIADGGIIRGKFVKE